MHLSGPYGSKWAAIEQSEPKWVEMDPSELKCDTNVTQLEYGNNKKLHFSFQILYKQVMLADALRTIVNKP